MPQHLNIDVPEEEDKKKGPEKILETIGVKNFPKMPTPTSTELVPVPLLILPNTLGPVIVETGVMDTTKTALAPGSWGSESSGSDRAVLG